jgi:hypothetical protein
MSATPLAPTTIKVRLHVLVNGNVATATPALSARMPAVVTM